MRAGLEITQRLQTAMGLLDCTLPVQGLKVFERESVDQTKFKNAKGKDLKRTICTKRGKVSTTSKVNPVFRGGLCSPYIDIMRILGPRCCIIGGGQ